MQILDTALNSSLSPRELYRNLMELLNGEGRIAVLTRVERNFNLFANKMEVERKDSVMDAVLYYVCLHNSFMYFSTGDDGTDAVNEGFAFLEDRGGMCFNVSDLLGKTSGNGMVASVFRERPVLHFLNSKKPKLDDPENNPLFRVQ